MKKKSAAVKQARVVLFKGTFQLWKPMNNQQAIRGFKTKSRAAAIRAARRNGLKPVLYGGAKTTAKAA